MNAPQAPKPLTDEELADCGLLSELFPVDPSPTLRPEPEAAVEGSGSPARSISLPWSPQEWLAMRAAQSPATLTNEQIAQIYLGADYSPGEDIPVWAYAFARKIEAAIAPATGA